MREKFLAALIVLSLTTYCLAAEDIAPENPLQKEFDEAARERKDIQKGQQAMKDLVKGEIAKAVTKNKQQIDEALSDLNRRVAMSVLGLLVFFYGGQALLGGFSTYKKSKSFKDVKERHTQELEAENKILRANLTLFKELRGELATLSDLNRGLKMAGVKPVKRKKRSFFGRIKGWFGFRPPQTPQKTPDTPKTEEKGIKIDSPPDDQNSPKIPSEQGGGT